MGSTKKASGQPLKARRLHSTPTRRPAPQASSRRWSGSARRVRPTRIQAQVASSSRPPPISIHRDAPYALLDLLPDLFLLGLEALLLGVAHVDQHEAVEEVLQVAADGVEDQEHRQRDQAADRERSQSAQPPAPVERREGDETRRHAHEEDRLPGEGRQADEDARPARAAPGDGDQGREQEEHQGGLLAGATRGVLREAVDVEQRRGDRPAGRAGSAAGRAP